MDHNLIIGKVWVLTKSDLAWEKKFSRLDNFIKITGRLPRIYLKRGKKELTIAHWIMLQKKKYNKNLLSAYRQARLESLSEWSWNRSSGWFLMLEKLKKFLEQNGGKYPKRNNRYYENKNIYIWIQRQRERFHKEKLNKWKIQKLEELPDWCW